MLILTFERQYYHLLMRPQIVKQVINSADLDQTRLVAASDLDLHDFLWSVCPSTLDKYGTSRPRQAEWGRGEGGGVGGGGGNKYKKKTKKKKQKTLPCSPSHLPTFPYFVRIIILTSSSSTCEKRENVFLRFPLFSFCVAEDFGRWFQYHLKVKYTAAARIITPASTNMANVP